jgi:hypothetical protein
MGWISANARNVSVCPFCKELIPKGAIRCSHCQSFIHIPGHHRKRPFLFGNFMLGFYAATALWLYLFLFAFKK